MANEFDPNELSKEKPQLTTSERLVEFSSDPFIHDLVVDVQNARQGANQIDGVCDYREGDIEGMHQAIKAAFDLREAGGERWNRVELPQKELFDDRIHELAVKIGLEGDTVPFRVDAQAALILGGAGKSPLERATYTRELIEDDKLRTNTVVLLGSSRPVDDAERQRAGEYAENSSTEYELMLRAASSVFKVRFEQDDELIGYDDSVPVGFESGWRIAHAETTDGKNIFVLSTPMVTDQFYPDGNRRPRANTADTYATFARVAQFDDPDSHVVAVTNAHFTPFQGADAVADLKKHGISAEVVGYDPSHFGNPSKTPEELLQETLSAVNSLMRASKTETDL